MKKVLRFLLPALLLLLLACYILVPNQITVSRKLTLHANQNGVVKVLTEKERWEKWWPAGQTSFVYDSLNFSLEQQMLKSVLLHVPFDGKDLNAQLNTVSYSKDSSGILFSVSLPKTTNPLKRVTNYFKSKKIASDADEMLVRLKTFAQKEENVYGMAIRQEKVRDTAFVYTHFETTGYPDTRRVYEAVTELRNYVQKQGASQRDSPMLHVEVLEGNRYTAMVAIPVDKPLRATGIIEPKRMIRGNILVAEVKGGVATVEKAMREFDDYVSDHHRNSPAIPFQSLIVNRQKETDSSKWITRLYYPVI